MSSFMIEIQYTLREEELDQNSTEGNSTAEGELGGEDLSGNSSDNGNSTEAKDEA